jgi:hypothetical protein
MLLVVSAYILVIAKQLRLLVSVTLACVVFAV